MIRKYDENHNTNIAVRTEQIQDLTVKKNQKNLLFTRPHGKACTRRTPLKA